MNEASPELARDGGTIASWRTVVRSFGVLSLGEALARLLSFGAIVWMTRRLGVEGFGVVALGGNLVLWFAVIVNSSTQTIGLRDVSRTPERFTAILEPLLGFRLALSALAMAVLAVTAVALGDSAEDRRVLLLFLLVLPPLALNLRFSLLAIGSATTVAVGNVTSQLLFAAGVLLLVNGPGDAIYVPVVQAVGELAFAAILLARVAPRVGLPRPRVDRPVWRAHLADSGALMATQVGRATIIWADSFLIAALLGQQQLGLYSAAYRPVLFVSYSLGLLFVSFLASYTATRTAADQRLLLSRTVRLTTLLALPIAVAGGAAAAPLVSLLFGDSYSDAAAPLAVLAWTIPSFALGSVFAMVLVAHGRQSLVMRHTLAGAAINLAANLVAVPTLGITAAAAVSAASWLVIVALNYRSCVQLGYADRVGGLLRGARPRPDG